MQSTIKKDYLPEDMIHGSSYENFWKFCKPFFSNKKLFLWKRKR